MEGKSLNEFTDQELEIELKKRKQSQIIVATMIGFLIGCGVWSATHKGGFVTFFILTFAFYLGKKNHGKVEEVTNEINSRKNLDSNGVQTLH